MDTQLSVSWSAYQKNICNGFSFLQQHGEFVDMTLAADGHHVQVHKMVLSLVSPYIKELVATTQCAHPVIFLNNVSKATLQYILEYVYTGEALVPKNNMKEFLQACNSLNIKGLEHIITVERKESTPSLSQGSSITKPVEKRHQIFISKDDENPIDISFDDDGHQDNVDFLEDNDEEMESTDETEMSSAQTNKQTTAKKQQQITNTGQQTPLQYTISHNGQLQIILNRYIYCFHYKRHRTNDLVWRCLYNRKRCSATITTKDGKVVRRSKAHNHPFADKSVLRRLHKGIVYSELKEAQSMLDAKNTNKDPNKSCMPTFDDD